MMDKKQHIIERAFLEVEVASEQEAYQIKNSISSFLQREVFPMLEVLLNTYQIEDYILRFDRLDIGLEVENWEDKEKVKQELIIRLKKQIDATVQRSYLQPNSYSDSHRITGNIQESIHTNNKDKAVESLPQQLLGFNDNNQTIILHFLLKGYLPWYGNNKNIEELIENENWKESLENTGFLAQLIEVLKSGEIVQKRFVMQFSNYNVIALLEKLGAIKNKTLLREFMDEQTYEFNTAFMLWILNVSLYSKNQERISPELIAMFHRDELKEAVSNLKSFQNTVKRLNIALSPLLNIKRFDGDKKTYNEVKKHIKEELIEPERKTSPDKKIERGILENNPTIIPRELPDLGNEKEPLFFDRNTNNLFVQNAGLVLFHPFLKTFFNQFNWLSENGKILQNHKLTAVQAMHYLATGNEDFFEGNMIFEKFLCGLPLNTPIPKNSLLSDNIGVEALNLLNEVIKNWPALKNTSPDGLRNEFIQRNGKLIQKDRGYKLLVERKVQDILLDKLQWNISIVKLPWKDDLLFVEW